MTAMPGLPRRRIRGLDGQLPGVVPHGLTTEAYLIAQGKEVGAREERERIARKLDTIKGVLRRHGFNTAAGFVAQLATELREARP